MIQFIKKKLRLDSPDKESAPSLSQPDIFASNPLDQAMDNSKWEDSKWHELRPKRKSHSKLNRQKISTPSTGNADLAKLHCQGEGRDALHPQVLERPVNPTVSSHLPGQGHLGNKGDVSKLRAGFFRHVVSKQRTLLNLENAEIFIHDNYLNLEPFIKIWKTNIKEFIYEEREDM